MRRLCYSIIDRLNQGSVRQSLTSRIFFHQLTDHHTIGINMFWIHRPGLTIGYKRFPLPFPFISLLISLFLNFLHTTFH